MTRDELIELGAKLIDASLPDEELERLNRLFSDNVPHPDGANLFFYPENYSARLDDISDYDPTVAEVVDLALRYKPIQIEDCHNSLSQINALPAASRKFNERSNLNPEIRARSRRRVIAL